MVEVPEILAIEHIHSRVVPNRPIPRSLPKLDLLGTQTVLSEKCRQFRSDHRRRSIGNPYRFAVGNPQGTVVAFHHVR